MGNLVTPLSETMSSTQIVELLDNKYEKKEINRKIKLMFQEKIDGGIISPSLDSRGYVIDYHLPEIEAKMFVAQHDIEYLEKITRYWVDQRSSGGMQEIDWSDTKQLAGLIQQSVVKVQEQQKVINIQQVKIEEDKPKVDFYDEFANEYGLFGLQNAARALHQPPNKFVSWLKQTYLFYQGGALVAKAKYIQMGLFEIKTSIIGDKPRPRTWMTNKGIQYFAKKMQTSAA